MVLESLINPISAERKPFEMFFIGAIYSAVAVLVSLLIFSDYASLMAFFLIVLMCSRIMYKTIQLEEEKEFNYAKNRNLFREHARALAVFTFMFLGITLTLSLFYIFLPAETASVVFEAQKNTITEITGNAINPGAALNVIFFSNLRLLVICSVFAFMFGFGAILILTWNASVMGVVIGDFVRETVGGAYLTSYSLGLLRYLTHGIPEIIAYFAGGLAAGIISVAIIRHDIRSKKFRHVLSDSAGLFVFSIGLLFAAALIEVFVTPFFF